jgi:methyltransferase
MTPAVLLLALVTAERLAELWYAQRNSAALLAQGAVEYGARHYPLLVALHAAWLAGLWIEGWDSAVDRGWLAAFLAIQVLRVWTLATLGRRWTTRILVLPNVPLVRIGPYRFMPHPNYAVVAGEIAVLPLCLGMPLYAAVFTVLNAAALFVRIRAEDAALAASRALAAR